MKRIGTICALLSTFVLLSSFTLKDEMKSDCDFIRNTILVKYAPLEWKQRHADFDLEYEVAMAKEKIDSLEAPSIKEFQIVLKEFFNSLKDYHASVLFYSTEQAMLPFTIKSAEGRYFIAHIDHRLFGPNPYNIDVGDEVVLWNGESIAQTVASLKDLELADATAETDNAMAELLLTGRSGAEGHVVPKERHVTITIQREEERFDQSVSWLYAKEEIGELPAMNSCKALASTKKISRKKEELGEAMALFYKVMAKPSFSNVYDRSGGVVEGENPHLIGGRVSFLPPLGRVLWRSDANSFFDSYLFETNKGKRVGYVRIAHYMGDEAEAEEFRYLVAHFNHLKANVLVVDQLNNPGGSVFYLYALASMLTDQPLATPKHHLTITQKEVYMAATMLPYLKRIRTLYQARQVIGQTVAGYPTTLESARLMIEFCELIISEWNAGKTLTRPTHIFGVDQIQPHPRTHFSGPILLLTNSLDFSGGDFFPAIMKEHPQVCILGTRTAGAGGYFFSTTFANRMGIESFHLTGSLALKQDQTPIENLGVHPDILYETTVNDLTNNYADHVKTILNTLDIMIASQ